MPKTKLTKSRIDKIMRPSSGQKLYFDTDLRGFGLCVGKKSKTYFIQRHLKGKTVRITIGRHGDLTPHLARREALSLLGRIAHGENPYGLTHRSPDGSVTLIEAFEAYLEARKDLKSSTVNSYRYLLNAYAKDLLNKPLEFISSDMIAKKHSQLGKERGASNANGTMRVLRAVFNHAKIAYKGLVTENPVERLSLARAWYRVERRRSLIKPTELKTWYRKLPRQVDSCKVEFSGKIIARRFVSFPYR